MPDSLCCRRCPRLVDHLSAVRKQHPTYHCAPVPSWGAAQPKLLIVGLAPGLHGANRSGRGFVGDSSSHFLFTALHATGFASAADPQRATLRQAQVTNAVKCLPPQNRVLAAEIDNCQAHLAADVAALWRPSTRRQRVILALGGVAYRACSKLFLNRQGKLDGGSALPQPVAWPKFGHGLQVHLGSNLSLLTSYHPSRQNVNTGRLNQAMLQSVLNNARGIIMGA